MQTYPPGTHIGQYEIASLPMMGGMGVVYFALDHGNDGHPVALKTFRPEFLPDRAARDRFLREGTAWVELESHPHIVRCYGVKYIDPTAFLVLELIAKEQDVPDASLRSWLIPGHPLLIEQALLFALQIAHGMQYATEKIPGFIHRDLKPENILVGADKLPGTNINRLRVTDFGLVKTIAGGNMPAETDEEEKLKPNQIQFTRGAGTPLYMAPEQWKGQAVGVFTDIYAFGCILYEMLSGQRAAQGKTITELQVSHCDSNLRPIPTNLPKDVIALLTNCLTTDPNQRYGNWDELTSEVERVHSKMNGVSAFHVLESSEFSYEERIQAGWSYHAIGEAYLDMGEAEKAIDFFEKALSIARENNDRHEEGRAMGSIGIAYAARGNAQQAVEYFEQNLAIESEIGNRSGEGIALCNLGSAYGEFGDARRAIDYYEKSLIIAREISDPRREGNALMGLGIVYEILGDAQKAIEYYEQCLEIYRWIGNRRAEGNALGNLGNLRAALGDVQRAIGYYEQCLVIEREIGDHRGEGNTLGNLGSAHATLGDVQRSIGYYKQSLATRYEISDLNGIAIDSFNMALLYARQGDNSQSLSLAQEATRIWTQIGHKSNIKRAQQLIAQLQGDSTHAPEQGNSVQTAFEAFKRSASSQDMQVAVIKYPIMNRKQFIQAIEEIINEQVPLEQKPAFEQRLTWLRQIANQK